MFTKILIANRGEIACRVIKTAKKMGILTVAVFSDADKDALHVHMADEAIYLGPSPAKDSYLIIDKVIAAAVKTGAQAIHPGYGFLSENSEFCQACAENNITFIGPPVGAIEAMGSKSAAKNIMEKASVPLVPGYHGDDQSPAILKNAADSMGYPILLKATAGGGGKGMRQVWSEQEFSEALQSAKREAMSSFADDTMLVEKYLTQPRHVEIQVFCDNHQNAVYLFERDCSVQRRHQKVIEEAPAFKMSKSLRKQMGESAIKSAQAIGYQGAGTVEFLLDVDGSFYFMEMNTRLQVEHPVTEMITGQDLVEWQLRVAAGEVLPKNQSQLTITGHAFEARIYAEDADNDFLPATGTLRLLKTPTENDHVRVDTGVRQGDEVSVYYDPMIAKLIVWDENRDKALKRLRKALSEYRISGVTTNIDFLYKVANANPFIEEDIDTGFIEKNHDLIFNNSVHSSKNVSVEATLIALYLVLSAKNKAHKSTLDSNEPSSPWHQVDDWRSNSTHAQTLTLLHNTNEFSLSVTQKPDHDDSSYQITINDEQFDCYGTLRQDQLTAIINGHRRQVTINQQAKTIHLYQDNHSFAFTQLFPDCGQEGDDDNHGGLTAPMNGTMVSVLVNAGDKVSKNQSLVIMEAMKMEHTIKAPNDGIIDDVYFQAGDMVDGGAELLAFTALDKE